MHAMKITFVNPGIEKMLENILLFQTDGTAAFWYEPLFYFYPQLDKARALSMRGEERKNYLARELRQAYAGLEKTIDEKVVLYSRHWERCRPQVTAALSDAFKVDCATMFNDIKCSVTMNPIAPRFLRQRAFDVFYLNSEKGAVGMALHEIIHFVWFHVWHETFDDSYDEYESPSLKWILSEMAVEPVMHDRRLSEINPYFPKEQGGCVYPYFYTMEIEGACILDTLGQMYAALPIRAFMESSYAYCRRYEAQIREHIRRAEGQ